jgi:hypothetical protein
MSAALRAIRLAFMNHNSDGIHGVATSTSPLLRRVDGIELPVAGAWVVPGCNATVAVCVPRGRLRSDVRMGRASEATIVIAEDPADVFVAVLFVVPGLEIIGAPAGALGPPIVLEAQSVAGPHRWVLTGEVFWVEGVVPLRATLEFHGLVCRRDDVPCGWFVLDGALDVPARTERPMRFRFELLASGPEERSRSLLHPSPASPSGPC